METALPIKKAKDVCPICQKKCRGVYVHLKMAHPQAIARLAENPIPDNSLDEKDIEIASLKEQVAQAPTSIADFPATEQAAYFKSFLETLSDEDVAVLAEETGFGPLQPLPATNGPEDVADEISPVAPEPVTETPSALEEKQPVKTVLVIGNRKFLLKG